MAYIQKTYTGIKGSQADLDALEEKLEDVAKVGGYEVDDENNIVYGKKGGSTSYEAQTTKWDDLHNIVDSNGDPTGETYFATPRDNFPKFTGEATKNAVLTALGVANPQNYEAITDWILEELNLIEEEITTYVEQEEDI